jgi:hypothetical protein
MLILTFVSMGIGTTVVGLPTYPGIDLTDPPGRAPDWFAVGGKWRGAVLIATEHSPVLKRGFYGQFGPHRLSAWPLDLMPSLAGFIAPPMLKSGVIPVFGKDRVQTKKQLEMIRFHRQGATENGCEIRRLHIRRR